MTEPTQEYLKECFDYFPETGELIWKERPLYHFKNKHGQAYFNSKYAGKRAGSISSLRGKEAYRSLAISYKGDRTIFLEHRIIWQLVYGELPKEFIDHINLNGLDNRLSNLRECDRHQNAANCRVRGSNKLGIKGVEKISSKYRASIRVNKRLIHSTLYETAEEAYQVYCSMAEQFQGGFAYHLSQQERQL